MSLSTRLALSVLASLVCAALLGAAALAGMSGMRGHFDAAAEQYEQLRSVYEVGHRASMIRLALATESPDRAVVERNLAAAVHEVGALSAAGDGDTELRARVESIDGHLQRVGERLEAGDDLRAASSDIEAAIAGVAPLAAAAKAAIVENRTLASARLTTTIRWMGALFAAAIALGLVAGVVQHRAVMRPVRALDAAAGQLAHADFSARIPERGALELRRLIERFNRMSDEIERLHASMRREVEVKSRQLVRSEQLASLGSLAAGLAHEINNPLGIIAGYAESTLKRLDEGGASDDPARERTRRVLGLICEEAFRCRDITAELLDLARPRDEALEPVDLAAVARRSVALVRGLPQARGREITIGVEPDAEATVRADEAQLIQVLINLLTNALESCEPATGRVTLSVGRRDDRAVASVADNGAGMDQRTLARAFDPFFTDKPQRGLTGAGLGLSVSHAIAERHGGRLTAASDGPGRGSVLTLELPISVCEEATASARA